jgi:outer membrane protein TolC
MTRAASILALSATLCGTLLSGCASVDSGATLARANADTAAFTEGKLQLAQTDAERSARRAMAEQLLQQPLSQKAAVQLAMANSPALQTLLAEGWRDQANAAQGGRIANPLWQFSHVRAGNELALERTLTFGLLDLLLLPRRQQVAQQQVEQAQLNLSGQVVQQVAQVRQAWVRAVAAQQSLSYANQVLESAEASAELARRMQAAGNFSKLMRARQQVFYADAASQLASARHNLTATREQLVRLLGLDSAQAAQLQLPKRLPDLPEAPRSPDEVAQAASGQRLDIRLAQAALSGSAGAQNLALPSSLFDVELGLRHDTTFADGQKTNGHGYEISVRLPLFDSGDARRAAMNANTLAMLNQLEQTARSAASIMRERYSGYRTGYDIARHYRDEVVPLRQAIVDEQVLRYNGMIGGVFELLADSRAQINTVLSAIMAEQQFWLAEAELQSAIVGSPDMGSMSSMGSMGSTSAAMGDSGGH